MSGTGGFAAGFAPSFGVVSNALQRNWQLAQQQPFSDEQEMTNQLDRPFVEEAAEAMRRFRERRNANTPGAAGSGAFSSDLAPPGAPPGDASPPAPGAPPRTPPAPPGDASPPAPSAPPRTPPAPPSGAAPPAPSAPPSTPPAPPGAEAPPAPSSPYRAPQAAPVQGGGTPARPQQGQMPESVRQTQALAAEGIQAAQMLSQATGVPLAQMTGDEWRELEQIGMRNFGSQRAQRFVAQMRERQIAVIASTMPQVLAAFEAGNFDGAARAFEALNPYIPDGIANTVRATGTGFVVERRGADGRTESQTLTREQARNMLYTMLDPKWWQERLFAERQQTETERRNRADEGLRGGALAIQRRESDARLGDRTAELGVSAARAELEAAERSGDEQRIARAREAYTAAQGRARVATVTTVRDQDQQEEQRRRAVTDENNAQAAVAAWSRHRANPEDPQAREEYYRAIGMAPPTTATRIDTMERLRTDSETRAAEAGTRRMTAEANAELAAARANLADARANGVQANIDVAIRRVQAAEERTRSLERIAAPRQAGRDGARLPDATMRAIGEEWGAVLDTREGPLRRVPVGGGRTVDLTPVAMAYAPRFVQSNPNIGYGPMASVVAEMLTVPASELRQRFDGTTYTARNNIAIQVPQGFASVLQGGGTASAPAAGAAGTGQRSDAPAAPSTPGILSGVGDVASRALGVVQGAAQGARNYLSTDRFREPPPAEGTPGPSSTPRPPAGERPPSSPARQPQAARDRGPAPTDEAITARARELAQQDGVDFDSLYQGFNVRRNRYINAAKADLEARR